MRRMIDMHWTKQAPTQPGWYWLRTVKAGHEMTEIVRINIDADSIPKSQWAGIFGSWPIGIEVESYWAGPIPEPTTENED